MTKARNIADLGSNDVIETTATGVDVTGTVTADGFQLGAGDKLYFNADRYFTPENNVDGAEVSANGKFTVKTGATPSKSLVVGATGNVSFYEDTGTTAKMVWDSSAENLYLANTNPVLAGVSTGVVSATSFTVGGQTSGADSMYIRRAAAADYQLQTTNAGVSGGEIHLQPYGGNVGIGTASPSETLTVVDSDSIYKGSIKFGETDSYFASIVQDAIVDGGVIYNSHAAVGTTHGHKFHINGTERARLDSSGSFILGGTSLYQQNAITLRHDGWLYARRDSNTVATLRRDTTDGHFITFDKDGGTAGAIGCISGLMTIGKDDTGLVFNSSTNQIYAWNMTSNSATDNSIDLGRSTARFDDIYATNGTIQTSDRNEKQDIETLSEAEQRVAQACKGLLRKFRWKDSVAEKGDDARIHFGIIAQDLQDAFTAEGLDAGRYAMFISSTWTDEETGEERTRLGVRYPELLAFIISAL